jgi:hypothetical protein
MALALSGACLLTAATAQAQETKVHAKRTLSHVKSVITPKTCPRAGWPVATQLSLQDRSTVLSKAQDPLPGMILVVGPRRIEMFKPRGCAGFWGCGWSSRPRTQAEGLAGGKAEAEDTGRRRPAVPVSGA